MFETVIARDKLLNPLSFVVGVTEKKNLMPYLANVLLYFGKESYTYATDLEISAIAKVDHETPEETFILVNAKKFYDALREMERGDIFLTVTESLLIVRQENTEFALTLYHHDDFPELKPLNPETKFQIRGRELLDVLDSISFAMATDQSRPVLCGAFLKPESERFTIVATDGFRMAVRRVPLSGVEPFPGVIVPLRAIKELEKTIPEEENVVIEIEKSQVCFRTSSATIISRTVEGKYPDYEAAIPKNYKIRATFEKVHFQRALKRVSALLGRNEPIRILFLSDGIELSSRSQEGTAKEVIPARLEGKSKDFYFNVRYLMDAASRARGDMITIELPEDFGAILLEDSSEKDYVNVIMPVKM
ncbi:MAG: DNA polymerase III subunit beta [Desulfobacterota bacterium]|nr:DNA polymerase III subunit beta [Thermodesulfobacteriota bacterium]MDW8001667.1 DNA polymerase III subunit beta [Deltaproteobacteria bacterium]